MRTRKTSARRSNRGAKPLQFTFDAVTSERIREAMRVLHVSAESIIEPSVEGWLNNDLGYMSGMYVYDTEQEADAARRDIAEATGAPDFLLCEIIPYDSGHGQVGFQIARRSL